MFVIIMSCWRHLQVCTGALSLIAQIDCLCLHTIWEENFPLQVLTIELLS